MTRPHSPRTLRAARAVLGAVGSVGVMAAALTAGPATAAPAQFPAAPEPAFPGAAGRPVSVPAAATARVTGGRVVAAAGQRQWIECRGNAGPAGKPTVVLVSGLGAGHNYWGFVPSHVALGGRVCWYDRPGLGSSPARLGRSVVSADTHAVELMTLLTVIGERSPMIFVGHSYGGLLVRAVGARFPGRTAGMVMVDSSYSTQWRFDSRYWPEAGGYVDMLATQNAVYRKPQLGVKPLGVVTAGRDGSANWSANQEYLATLSRNSFHVTVDQARHVVMATHPAAVIRAVNLVRTSARTGRHLPACGNLYWSQVGAHCGS